MVTHDARYIGGVIAPGLTISAEALFARAARLPRVETLLNIAERHTVSLDWLLGISQDEGLMGALLPSMQIETSDDDGAGLLIKWHAEATEQR